MAQRSQPTPLTTLGHFNPKLALADIVDGETTPVVAIDADGVLVDYVYDIVNFAEALDVYTNPYTSIDHWELYPHIFDDKDAWLPVHTALMEQADRMTLLDDTAAGAIATMRAAGIQVDIVTARNNAGAEDLLDAFCSTHNIVVDTIVARQDKHNHGMHILFDDHTDNLVDAFNHGIIPIRKPWPYNLSEEACAKLPTPIPSAATIADLAAWVIAGIA